MPSVRGCKLPDELLYDVDNHTWYRDVGDGIVEMGMTTVATALAGQLVAFTPKKVGRSVQAGKSCATIESGKWVGPAKAAGDGEVVAVNDAMIADPKIANTDPYATGWLVRLKFTDWNAVKADADARRRRRRAIRSQNGGGWLRGLRPLMLQRLNIEPDALERHADAGGQDAALDRQQMAAARPLQSGEGRKIGRRAAEHHRFGSVRPVPASCGAPPRGPRDFSPRGADDLLSSRRPRGRRGADDALRSLLRA